MITKNICSVNNYSKVLLVSGEYCIFRRTSEILPEQVQYPILLYGDMFQHGGMVASFPFLIPQLSLLEVRIVYYKSCGQECIRAGSSSKSM